MRLGVLNDWLARAYDDAYLRHNHEGAYDFANAGLALYQVYNIVTLGEGPSQADWLKLQAQASRDMVPY